MCLYPQIIKNPKYKKNKKNKGNIPYCRDSRIMYIPIGCGNCIECRKKKARDWKVRLYEEIKKGNKCKFVTLTFSRESILKLKMQMNAEENEFISDNSIATHAMRKFLERWRKKYKKSVRHWFITEKGGTNTQRIHLHGLLWTNENREIISKIWKYGFIYIDEKKGFVNETTINYIMKYVTKIDIINKDFTGKILTSPGIGDNYTKCYNAQQSKYKGKSTKDYYLCKNGQKMQQPIYWRNKLYSETERELLWINKLDENIRYIMGEKIKADDTTTINKTLKYYQQENIKLGYGKNTDWNEHKYSNRIEELTKLRR